VEESCNMTVKKAYYYVFYKLYKFWEAISAPKFWSNWKASLSIDILEIFLALSAIVYYAVFTRTILNIDIKKPVVLAPFAAIVVINYFIFHHHDQWKDIIVEFDQWEKRKNRIGGCVIGIVAVAIIANLIFAFYIMSKIDWSKYR